MNNSSVIVFCTLFPCFAERNVPRSGLFKKIIFERNNVYVGLALIAISAIGVAMKCPPLVIGAVVTFGVGLTCLSLIRLWNATFFLRNPDQDFRDPFILEASWQEASWQERRDPFIQEASREVRSWQVRRDHSSLSEWQTPPPEALDPQAGPAKVRLTQENTELGIYFIRDEIFSNLDRATKTALFEAFDPESFTYVIALTSFIYVFGSKSSDPLPTFLKPKSQNGILALRYALGVESNSEVPSTLPEELRQKIQTLRALENRNQAIACLQSFMIQNPQDEDSQPYFLSLENYKKDRTTDGDPDAIRNFFANETAKRILNELKLATSFDLFESDFITVCFQQAMPQD